jgi:putative N-acetylmannosamine-6-phosphate epimerase
MRIISKMLDEMDKFPEMENFYIVMDNTPIHRPEDDIDGMIERTYSYCTAITVALRL